MSKTSLEQAISGLLPTLDGLPPPELLDLASSLLARSRSVAHSLKSEEEIGRPYACAQLACERLKKRLNLPAIVSRPPCPPRVYKKLYSYLNSTLPAMSRQDDPQTPRKPTSAAPASAQTTPKSAFSARKTPRSMRKPESETPEWVMPAIRRLVKTFNYPLAAPHVYTGVESVLPLLRRMSVAAAETPSKRPRRATTANDNNVSDGKVLALLTVIFLYVYARMKDEEITPEQYRSWRESAIQVLLEDPAGSQTNYEDVSAESEELMPLAQTEGWLRMEWFLNVMPPEGWDEMEGVETTDIVTQSDNKGTSKNINGSSDYIGLGTMLQDATDYLSEARREDYLSWKRQIMARVKEIEGA